LAGRQHRRLPQAANTLAPPLIVYTLTAALVDYYLMCIKAGFDGFLKKISEVAPQTSLDIAFGPLSEMLANHWPTITCSVYIPTRIN